jgi:site-specific recombinase XerD
MLTADSATDQYLEWLADVRRLSPNTVRAYSCDLRQWVLHVGPRVAVGALPHDSAATFAMSQHVAGMADRTVVRRLAAVRGFHGWLTRNGLVQAESWNLTNVSARRGRVLPRTARSTDLLQLHRHLRQSVLRTTSTVRDVRSEPHHATTLLAVSLMLATGARVSETASIDLGGLDRDSGSIRIHGKGSRDRTVYIVSGWLQALLDAYLAVRAERSVTHRRLLFNRLGEPMTAAAIRHRLHSVSQVARLESVVTPHMLRHAAATNLLEAGIDIRIVQRLLGHASISTTEIYTHVSDRTLRQALASADVLGRRFLDDN